MKKVIAMVLLACLVCGLVAGCGAKKKLTAEEAYQVVVKDLKETYGEAIAATVASPHIHEATYEGKPCFNIFVTVNGMSLQYIISQTGDILHAGAGEHSH